jgi:hypothetical protein
MSILTASRFNVGAAPLISVSEMAFEKVKSGLANANIPIKLIVGTPAYLLISLAALVEAIVRGVLALALKIPLFFVPKEWSCFDTIVLIVAGSAQMNLEVAISSIQHVVEPCFDKTKHFYREAQPVYDMTLRFALFHINGSVDLNGFFHYTI